MRAWSKRELIAYLDRVLPALDGLNHYQLLDVAPTATPKAIQSAFHAMAAGLHPDRHRTSLSAEQHEKLIIVYARIAEAYRVLRDPEHTKAYLQKHARELKTETAQSAKSNTDADAGLALLNPKAQQLYRRAIAAQRTGDLASATLNMRMALAKHPQSDFLREALRSLSAKK